VGPLLGAAIALCLIAREAQSQTTGITVSRRSSGRVEADPGAGITAVFLVRNSTARAREIHADLALPSGWRLVTPDSPFLVGAHQAELRLLRLAVPGDATPGTYGIQYTSRGAPAGTVLARDSLFVIVRASRRLELQPLDAPELVLAGKSYQAAFMVRNSGNVTTRVRIEVASSYALPARPDSDVVHLAPGAARSVSVTVQTDQDAQRPLRHRLDVVARAVADSSAVATAFSLVDVIPRSGAGPPRFHHLPVQMTLWATEPGDGMTGEIRASGALTDGGADRIEMLLRGPDNAQGLFGDRDEYRVTLTGNRYQLRLGDQSFRLSPLTETGRAGFGGGGQLSIGRLTAGGFMQRDRWTYQYTGETQRAGFLSARIAGRSSLGVNYIERLGDDSGKIWSVRGVLAPIAGTALDLEYGTGTGVAGTGAARSVLLTGMHRLASYRVHAVRADRNYPGAVRGVTYEDADLTIHPGGGINLTGRFIDRTTSSMLVSGAAGDQRYRSMQGGVAFGHYLSAEYLRSRQEGGLFAPAYGGREEAIRLRTGLVGRLGAVYAGTELGRFEYAGDPQRHPFQQLFLQASLRPGEHSSYFVAVERHHGSTIVSPRSQDWLSAQVHAAFQLWRGTRFRFAWNGRRYGIDPPSTYGVVDATWEQDLPFGHRLVARARVVSFGGTQLPAASLLKVGYTIPLSLPVSASHRSGRLVGRIYDATSGDPIANALVRVGDRAQLSDKSGRLVFSGLAPDTYYVHVDRHSLAGRQVALEQDPLPLRVGKLETTRFELGMVRGARLTGTVRISAFAIRSITGGDDGALVDSAAMPNVIVALTGNDGKVLRRLTDAGGRFTFSGLPPGRWTLSMPPEALPEHYQLQRDSVPLDIAPGDTLHAQLRMVPQRRTLHIVATVDLTAERGSSRTPGSASGKPPRGVKQTPEPHRQRITEPASGPSQQRPAIRHRYTVTRWDVGLALIALYVYNDASLWPKIWVANQFQLRDADIIRPGQKLLIPDKAPLTRSEIAARDAYLARLQ
jgi:hypothetical protein